jgi:hypothetical protein
MDEDGGLAGRFEANRTHLPSVAYRMLGSRSVSRLCAGSSSKSTWSPTRSIFASSTR